MFKRGDKKIGICEYTKKKIVKVCDGKNWICLHNNNARLDELDVEEFEKSVV